MQKHPGPTSLCHNHLSLIPLEYKPAGYTGGEVPALYNSSQLASHSCDTYEFRTNPAQAPDSGPVSWQPTGAN